MNENFPRTEVAGVSLPRLLIGTNWLLGYSHQSGAADAAIKQRFDEPSKMAELLGVFLRNGIDAIMAPISANPCLCKAIAMAEEQAGKRIIGIDTPVLNVDDNAQARKEAQAAIKRCKTDGKAVFCLPHHMSCEQLVNKNKRTMERLPDYLAMIRDEGMIPGLSAHMPEIIQYSDENAYDVQTYIQIYNCMGFLMQVEIEQVHKIIWNAQKPVMTIKPMAAGRCTPFVGLSFAFATLRPCDMVTVGTTTPQEAEEDIEIARAALERRKPEIKARGSVAPSSILKD